jgi:hypothetical protein
MARQEEIAKGMRSQNGKKPKGKQSQGDFRFINVTLSEAQKDQVRKWGEGETNVWGYVEELVGAGYRVGINFDEHNACFSASITNRSGPTEFRGVCVTFRGPTAFDALLRVVGVHYVVAGEDWTFLEKPGDPDDLW